LNIISEKAYLIVFSIAMSVLIVLFLLWIVPKGLIEYNFGINVVTSLLSTVITVIFLSLFLAIREEGEWGVVKKNAYAMIGTELGILFAELLRFTENELDEIGFKSALLFTKDSKIRRQMIFSKLSELQKKEPFQLVPSSFSIFRSDRALLTFFLDVKRNLGDVQIRYERHLNSKVTERLMKLQSLLELMNMTHRLDTAWNSLQGQMPLLKELMNRFMPKMLDQNLSSTDLVQNVLPTYTKSLIQELYELWKLGIEFDLA
jgi:hypothetical protein